MRFGTTEFTAEREQRVRSSAARLWLIIVWLLGALVIFQGLRSTVVGGITADDLKDAASSGGGAVTGANVAYQIVRASLVAVAVIAIAHCAPISMRRPRAMSVLWLGIVLMSLSMIVSTTYSTHSPFSLTYFELPLIMAAIWALPAAPLDRTLKHIRRVLLVVAYGSLAYLIVAPAGAAQAYYGGLIPGLSTRLHGITPHANILGAAMGIYLCLELARKDSGLLVWVHRLVVIAALLLSQSKTTIGILVAVILVSALFANKKESKGRFLRFVVGTILRRAQDRIQ